mmetsp:Transcript_31190/g.46582  ORF Transcript_31190/g.46582 Transcript_31190/m.46582 type:complete len:200 (-) Transcript_31190:1678-2277(-)
MDQWMPPYQPTLIAISSKEATKTSQHLRLTHLPDIMATRRNFSIVTMIPMMKVTTTTMMTMTKKFNTLIVSNQTSLKNPPHHGHPPCVLLVVGVPCYPPKRMQGHEHVPSLPNYAPCQMIHPLESTQRGRRHRLYQPPGRNLEVVGLLPKSHPSMIKKKLFNVQHRKISSLVVEVGRIATMATFVSVMRHVDSVWFTRM